MAKASNARPTKAQRQHRLVQLIAKNQITNQPDLVDLLRADGVVATQATVSRDLEDLGAVKVRIPGGETVGHTDNYNCMRDNIPDVTVKYYDGLPHNICDSVPERCAEDALSFLQSRFPDGFSPART